MAAAALLTALGMVALGGVVANANTVPAGTYTGTSDAYNGAEVAFEIDSAGRMSGFDTQSYIQCGLFPSAMPWAEMPPTQVTAGEPFEVEWTVGSSGSLVKFELDGTVQADGTASGRGLASMPELSCAGYRFNWTASTDATLPVYDPEASVSPSTVTVSDLADTGVTVTGTGFAPDSTVTLSAAGSTIGTATANGDGDVSFDYTGSHEPGSLQFTLAAPEGTATATLTVEADPAPVYDPEASVSPSTVTVSDLADTGVTVTGTGFAPGSTVSLSAAGSTAATATANANGDVSFDYTGNHDPGSLQFTLTAPEGTASTTLAVEADPAPVYDPEVSVSPSTVIVSDLANSGVTVTGTGFAPNSTVTLAAGGNTIGTATANGDGDVSFDYTGSHEPGALQFTLTAPEGTASTTLTVEADPAPVYDPEASVSPSTITVSDLADTGVTVNGSGFAPGSAVTLTVGGEDTSTADADADGNVSFSYTGAHDAGSLQLTLSSADGSASTTLTVETDPAPVYDPEASVSPSTITVSDLANSGVTVTGTGFAPDSTVTLSAAGSTIGTATANGDGDVSFGYNGSHDPGTVELTLSSADGSASTTLTVEADPAPVYDPEASVSPSTVTVSDLADTGVTVTGTDFAPGSTVTLTVAGENVGTADADGDGNVSFGYTGNHEPGSLELTLSSADGTATATLTVEADPAPPTQLPATPPTEDDLTPDAEGGIDVPPRAEEGSRITVSVGEELAGTYVGIWLFSDPVHLGTLEVDAAGEVSVQLPDGVTGAHRVAAFGEDEGLIGWDGITIVQEDDGPSPTPDPDPSETPDPDPSETPDPDPTPSPDPTVTPTADPTADPTSDPDDPGLPDSGVDDSASPVTAWATAVVAMAAAGVAIRRRITS